MPILKLSFSKFPFCLHDTIKQGKVFVLALNCNYKNYFFELKWRIECCVGGGHLMPDVLINYRLPVKMTTLLISTHLASFQITFY